jgi:hypothetical protein
MRYQAQQRIAVGDEVVMVQHSFRSPNL